MALKFVVSAVIPKSIKRLPKEAFKRIRICGKS